MKFLSLKIFLGVGLLLCAIFLGSGNTFGSEIGLSDSDISITTIPLSPEPYEDITITLSSFATDLNKAFIEWRSGGKTLISGYGKTSYSFKAPAPDTRADFEIIITPPDSSDRLVKKWSVTPQDIEILWQGADSYTPPFYRGKSFPGREGSIKVVAIPTSKVITGGKGNTVYTWKNDGKTVESASGYGKDSYVFTNDELKLKERVSVNVSSVKGDYNAVKTIDIPISDPKIIFYKKSPSQGVLYETALSDGVFMSDEEFTIVAEPYFLSAKQDKDKFAYDWQINGKGIDTPSKKTELTVRPSSRGGYATIQVIMENLDSLFQKASASLRINI